MSAKRRPTVNAKTQLKLDVKRVRTVNLMVGLNDDGTSSAVLAVMNEDEHRYTFVRLPDRPWWGRVGDALSEALREAAMDAGLDEECRLLLR